VNRLATISFSVFLVHFPVCLVVNAAFTRFVSDQPHEQALGMLVAWAASLAAGAAFYRWVELPLGRILTSRPKPVLYARLPAKPALLRPEFSASKH
jgi:peptidoglycan/LPS O-acetylase OafA/YrhL